eukprot:scaffold26497_cov46-Attheya_sp.AAC.1
MVAKWGVDMVTRGGELLIATRCSSADDGRRKRFEQGRSGVLVVILSLSSLSYVYAITTYRYVPLLTVRGDCAEATDSWMESGIRHK